MERPPQHVTETESSKIFAQAIPSEWVIRDISPDYGLDKSIEVAADGKISGKEVFIQLKGTKTINITNGYAAYSMEAKHLKYYLERDNPVVLTVVDIASKKCYWLFVQEYIYEILEVNNPTWKQQETITLKIPLTNELSSTIARFRGVAEGGTSYILLKKLNKIPIEQLEHWETNSQAIKKLEEVEDKFLQKQFEISFDISQRFEEENDYEKSINKLREIANQSKSKDLTTYCKASLIVAYHLNPVHQSKEIFQLLESIKETVKNCCPALRIMWEGAYLETLFAKLLNELNTYSMMYAVASTAPQGTMAPYIGAEKLKIIKGLYNIQREFPSLLDRAITEKQAVLYLDLQRRLLKMQFLWFYNNCLEDNPKTIYSQIDSIKKTLILALDLANGVSKDIVFELYIDLAFVCASIEDNTSRDNYIEKALKTAESLNHKGFLERVKSTKEGLQKSISISEIIKSRERGVPEDDISDEEEEKLTKMLIKRAGIDLEGMGFLSMTARIGLKDRNPERVLKFCENLHTEILSWSPIFEPVGLLTTGMKILFCEKNCVPYVGFELDNLLEQMKTDCCSACNNHCPRPADWRWTHKWHRTRGQPLEMKKIMSKLPNV